MDGQTNHQQPASNIGVTSKIDVYNLRGRRATNRWERISIGDLFERVKWSQPDKEAIIGWHGAYENSRHSRLTYAQVDDLANQFANGLLDSGLVPGDVVAMFCENSVEAVVAKIGIAKAGMVSAPFNVMLAPDQLSYLIDFVEPRFLIADADLWSNAGNPFAEKGVTPGIAIGVGGIKDDSYPTFTDFVSSKSTREPEIKIHGDDIYELLFTSGTTSMPKAVMLSHTNAYMWAYSFQGAMTDGFQFQHHARVCTFLPIIYHSGDILIATTALCGGTLVVGRGVDPVQIVQAIDTEQITCLWAGMPRVINAVTAVLNSRSDFNASTLKAIIFGWSAMPQEIFDDVKKCCGSQVSLCGILGMTELVCAHRFWIDDNIDLYRATAPKENYIGLPSTIMASKLIDINDNTIPIGSDTPGEAVYRSPGLMAGYFKNPEETQKAFRTGWYHSGDVFQYGENNHRKMYDRLKDVIKSGGENVASGRVESVLERHDAVERAAVIGLPHDRWDEAVTAVVIPKSGAIINNLEQELITFCKERLAAYETPKRVLIVESIPVTVGGKLLKHRLRKMYTDLYKEE